MRVMRYTIDLAKLLTTIHNRSWKKKFVAQNVLTFLLHSMLELVVWILNFESSGHWHVKFRRFQSTKLIRDLAERCTWHYSPSVWHKIKTKFELIDFYRLIFWTDSIHFCLPTLRTFYFSSQIKLIFIIKFGQTEFHKNTHFS